MATVQSTLYWGMVGIICILLFPFALVIRLITHPFDRKLKLMHLFTSVWASLFTWLSPSWRVRVEGRDKMARGAHYVMVSNHQSMVDILVLFRIFAHFKWVSKSENFKIPFVGWNMRFNRYIEIDRGSVKGSGKMMQDCEKAISDGNSIMIFPEGTRSDNGELRAFKRGAFEIAMKTKTDVLPIVVEGSSRALPKKGVVIRGKHRIHVKILDPVRVAAHASAEALSNHVRSLIHDELHRMRSATATAT